jgi:transcriptional regulator with XRE-family HTH domain
MLISPEQIRAARALLRMEQAELAERAQVSVVTIRRLEAVSVRERVAQGTLDTVQRVLEAAGVEFIPDGVRKRPATRPEQDSLYQDLRAISLRGAERLRAQDLLTDADLYDENGLPG